MSYLSSEAEIREIIGTPPDTVNIKKINLLEKHSKRYLAMSHLIAITAENISNVQSLLSVLSSGFHRGVDFQ